MTAKSIARRDPPILVGALIAIAVIYMAFVLLLPLATVFWEALSKGIGPYFAAMNEPDAISAIQLTLLVTAIAVPLNTIFGLAASWCIAKFDFWGKSALVTIIDLPFSISPVIVGLMFVLLYGSNGWFGPWLLDHNIQIIFTVTALVLATTLVTLPFVARELIPLMQAQGTDEEAAAATLGAGAWRTFFLVTLPNVRWALMYGVLLCTARSMGEFGAVAVVSGLIRGQTATMPLYVNILYNEYNAGAAFAIASLLALFALVTLAVKTLLEARHAVAAREQRAI
ncbi:MAG: sulfate ABC transporter permease subunit CysW [Terricaulis sp.]